MTERKDTCGSCRFYQMDGLAGECRRVAAVVLPNGSAHFPRLDVDVWCGEFERAELDPDRPPNCEEGDHVWLVGSLKPSCQSCGISVSEIATRRRCRHEGCARECERQYGHEGPHAGQGVRWVS